MFNDKLTDMEASILILGRQPAISLAELESLYGPKNVEPFNDQTALVKFLPTKINLDFLGGCIKLCQPLHSLNSNNWQEITSYIITCLPQLIENTTGKINLGISVYGLTISPQKINATSLKLKKFIKTELAKSARVVPNIEPELSSAQVIHNKLTANNGIEIIISVNQNRTIIAKTISVQNIFAYANRDQKRPARDAKVGMLPPKLAQIIINLALGQNEVNVLLDPFCGTAVILQEILIRGLSPYGTDLDQRMVDFSTKNLNWLLQKEHNIKLHQADATKFHWDNFDTIASETYLGRPFSTEPNHAKLKEVIQDVNTIIKKFLKNVAGQTKPGFRMCLAVPAWFTKNGIKHLPIIDQLTDLRYTQVSFVHAKNHQMIYHRDNQIVGRELLVLIRK